MLPVGSRLKSLMAHEAFHDLLHNTYLTASPAHPFCSTYKGLLTMAWSRQACSRHRALHLSLLPGMLFFLPDICLACFLTFFRSWLKCHLIREATPVHIKQPPPPIMNGVLKNKQKFTRWKRRWAKSSCSSVIQYGICLGTKSQSLFMEHKLWEGVWQLDRKG